LVPFQKTIHTPWCSKLVTGLVPTPLFLAIGYTPACQQQILGKSSAQHEIRCFFIDQYSAVITITMPCNNDNDNNVANLLKFQNCLRHLKGKRQLMKTRTSRSIQPLPTHQQCTVFLKYISLICLYDQFCHL